MPLVGVGEVLADALAQGYAVGYFESWNLESLQGVIDAAEHARAPILIGVNGEFMSSPDRVQEERLALHAALYRAAAEVATVPCALVFNECRSDEWIRAAVRLGFGQVMLDDDTASSEDLRVRARELARYAHEHGVLMEAELGELPCGAGDTPGSGELTDPEEAVAFVADTGIDILAVSVGNVHIKLDGEQGLDLERLARLHECLSIPLDLHGGTGIPVEALQAAIGLGVAKVCYGTYVKQRYLEALRNALAGSEPNPHRLLGMGGSDDLLVRGRWAVRDAVLERIEYLGCCGRVA